MSLSLILVEDDNAVGSNVQSMFEANPDFTLLAWYQSAEQIEFDKLNNPDFVLLDLGLPGISGLELIRPFKQAAPKCKILIFTIFDDDDKVVQAIQLGADGYLLKDTPPDLMLNQLHSASLGGAPISAKLAQKLISRFQSGPTQIESPLTERESTVLSYIALGYKYKDIADELDVSPFTIRRHTENIYRKLEVNSKSEAIIKARRSGFLSLE